MPLVEGAWTRFKWARFRFNRRPEHPYSLTAVSAARWGRGWGRGRRGRAPDLVTVGWPNRAALCAWLCYLRFVIKAPVLLLDVRKVTQPLVFFPVPGRSALPALRGTSLVIPKDAYFQLCFCPPAPPRNKSSFKGGHGSASLGLRGTPEVFFPPAAAPAQSRGEGRADYCGFEKLGPTSLP